jgi:hypothetical protein
MRIALLIAVSALVAGCSSGGSEFAERSALTPTSSSTARSAPNSKPTTTSTKPSTGPNSLPAAGTAITDVVSWVEGGGAADRAKFRSATREGTTTDLGDDVAFTSGKANCMTDSRFDGALACLVDLADPPPKPSTDVYGEWKGGWVDFEGATAEVGSVHGDPGRFSNGKGAELPAGQSLVFGDYRCRAEQAGVVCVNYAHQSAIMFSGKGIETFGCLRTVTPPAGVGLKFSC